MRFTDFRVIGPNSAEFGLSTTCSVSVPLVPGAVCTVSLTFMPAGSGTRAASLQVTSNALGGVPTIPISGTGLPADDFAISATPQQRSIVAGNSTTFTLNTAVTRGVAQAIALSADCGGLTCIIVPASVTAGQSATITVPTTAATLPGSYPISITAVGTSVTHTPPPPPPVLSVAGPANLSPAAWTFGSVQIGAASAVQAFTLTNSGPAALNVGISFARTVTGDFSQTNNCGASLGAGASCAINVTFRPTGTGGRTANLLVTDSAADSPRTAAVSGVGPSICSTIGECGYAKQLITGKSTSDNALIFAAFSRLAQAESKLGNTSSANLRNAQANAAGDFVRQMFDSAAGRFLAGAATTDTGESLDRADYLDSQTLSTLALSSSARYRTAIDWTRPLQHSLTTFGQNITEGGLSLSGLDLVPSSGGSAVGISWEHTAQAVAAMQSVSANLGTAQFDAVPATYLTQLAAAQMAAQFGDGVGVVGAAIQNGDLLPPYRQCLATPYQCIPKRVSLAATAGAIFADLGINPLSVSSPVLSIVKTHTGNFTQGQNGATYSVTVWNATGAGPTSGTVTVTETAPSGMTLVSMAGSGWTCPASGTTCATSNVLTAGTSYPPIAVTVNVASNAGTPLSNSVSVSAGGSAAASANDLTTIAALGPSVVSVAPGSGSAASAAFALTVSDPSGPAAIAAAVLLVNNTLTGTEGCFVNYSPSTNSLTLANNAVTAWTGPSVVGSGAALSNSQCTVNAAGASVMVDEQGNSRMGGSIAYMDFTTDPWRQFVRDTLNLVAR